MFKIILGTHNFHKITEFKKIFQEFTDSNSDFPILSLLSLDDLNFDFPQEIAETGDSFVTNALIKAKTIFNHLPPSWKKEKNTFVLSDDSGLVVPILNGEPGIYSARYATLPPKFDSDQSSLVTSKNKIDRDYLNRQKLLTSLKPYRDQNREAFFNTTLVLYGYLNHLTNIPNFKVIEGKINGTISSREKGQNGFGYDSVFIPTLPHLKYKNTKTFAEMSSIEKNTYSHRAIAIKNLKSYLKEMLKQT